MSRRFSKLLPFYEYDEAQFFRSDDAPRPVAEQRRQGFERLSAVLRARAPKTLALSEETKAGVADMQFIGRYRVPFQYSRLVRERLPSGSFLESSSGVRVTDLDGNELIDLTGSYGVNLMGYDFYKGCMERGAERVKALGPVLGAYHPVLADNVRRLKAISGLDEVSFHMSGTEAVMQAVRLARYHTGRTHLVRFCGSYHGWWGDVQPGVGNPVSAERTYTLKDMSDDTLRVLRKRKDIACVLVNPLQALHPNGSAPSDSTLLDSSRQVDFDREAYTAWLKQVREVCTQRGIVLIMDEVFMGFRLGAGGAQEYFGVKADMVTYGKTLGGGLPIGVVCGRHELMQRFREDKPADVCFARGTFNSHPHVMAAMNEFLIGLETPEVKAMYANLEDVWDARAARLNARLREEGLPVEVKNMSTVWTVCYTRPGRYNWMLQYYLRAAGLGLSWIGTGRFIFSLNFTDADFAEVESRFIEGAKAMERDGFFWDGSALTNKDIKRRVLREMISVRLRGSLPAPASLDAVGDAAPVPAASHRLH